MDIYEDKRWKSHPMIQKHWETMMTMKSFVEDDQVLLKAIDTSGPRSTSGLATYSTPICPRCFKKVLETCRRPIASRRPRTRIKSVI